MDIAPNRSFQRISELQITKGRFQNGLVEQTHLADALVTRPDEMSTVLACINGHKYFLSSFLEGTGLVADNIDSIKATNIGEAVGNNEYRWALMGDILKTVTIVGAPNPAANLFPGVNFSSFELPLADRYLELGDFVKFPCGQIARVQQDPIQVGTTFVYTFQLSTNNPNDYVPASDLEIGTELAWVWNGFEEYSDGGSAKTASPFWMQNQLSTMRHTYGMTGSAASDVMYLTLKRLDGKTTTSWMDWSMYINMLHWKRERELMLWYGRYNKTPNGTIHLPGANGRPVRQGAGVLQQISPHNTTYYSTLTESFLYDFVNHLQINSNEVENSDLMLVTGLGGIRMFDQALKTALQSQGVTSHDRVFVNYDGKDGDMQYGNYFKTYKGIMGTTITVKHNPAFDDPNTHTKKGPNNLPLESYRMVFLQMGKMSDGKGNIVLKRKDGNGVNRSMMHWYTAGSTMPSGSGVTQMLRSNSYDGWKGHFLSEIGVCVRNPMCCGQLIMR